MRRRAGLSDWQDVVTGVAGVGIIVSALLTPFLRRRRIVWGAGAATAGRSYPGDDLVARPRWAWTHAIDIDAPAEAVWPWVAQIGADRAGFYSYQWLENLVGCQLCNADVIRPDWAHRAGGSLLLHPKAPPLHVVAVADGRWLSAYMAPTQSLHADAQAPATRWMTASWLFLVEPCGADRCRLISRYRCATSNDLATRLQFGAALIEPISFAMDRRMLIGIKQRAEERAARLQPRQNACRLPRRFTRVRAVLRPGAGVARRWIPGRRGRTTTGVPGQRQVQPGRPSGPRGRQDRRPVGRRS
jgi:hypothetical protein